MTDDQFALCLRKEYVNIRPIKAWIAKNVYIQYPSEIVTKLLLNDYVVLTGE